MHRASLPIDDLDESGVRQCPPSLVAAPPVGALEVVTAANGRLCAVKRLHPALARGAYFPAIVADEVAVAASIRHENIVTSHGLHSYEGGPCLVMDHVPGLTGDAVIRNAHPFGVPVPFALKIVADVLRGLHAAHALAVIHREVSPQNIVVGVDGIARVFDFGIAKAAQRIHRKGNAKLAYMAPEQMTGMDIDGRTDVRGAGVVLWELLTGAPLFHTWREEDCAAKILRGRVRRPSELRNQADISPAVDALVLRALAPDPNDRFPTALAMAEAIDALGYDVSPRRVGEWIQDIGADELDSLPTETSCLPPPAKRPRSLFATLTEPAVLFISAVLLGAGGGLFVRLRLSR